MSERRRKRTVPVEDEVVASIAHDLGNLLAVIDTCADTAAREAPSEGAVAENLVDIRAAARRGADLVTRLRRLGREPAADAESDVGAVVRALVPTLQAMVGPETRVEAEAIAPALCARVDEWQLERALCHLVAGARSRGATRIVLSAGRMTRRGSGAEHAAGGTVVRILVEDDGRAQEASDASVQTAQRIVSAARGRAWARSGATSATKTGACAFVELPALSA
jgi:signal transduction histidine kinase